jgi:hypothetical protein
MASGQQITLNFGGNSLVDVTISQGTLNALVSNKRAIIADGGQVIMTAKAADEVLSAQVNNSGIYPGPYHVVADGRFHYARRAQGHHQAAGPGRHGQCFG